MPTDRTVYQYHFKIGRKIIRAGITGDIDYREYELREQHGKGKMKQIGWRTTYENARAWLEEQREQGRPVEIC